MEGEYRNLYERLNRLTDEQIKTYFRTLYNENLKNFHDFLRTQAPKMPGELNEVFLKRIDNDKVYKNLILVMQERAKQGQGHRRSESPTGVSEILRKGLISNLSTALCFEGGVSLGPEDILKVISYFNILNLTKGIIVETVKNEAGVRHIENLQRTGQTRNDLVAIIAGTSDHTGGHAQAFVRVMDSWYNVDGDGHATFRFRPNGQPTWSMIGDLAGRPVIRMIYCYISILPTSLQFNYDNDARITRAVGLLHGNQTFSQSGRGSCVVDSIASSLFFANGYRHIMYEILKREGTLNVKLQDGTTTPYPHYSLYRLISENAAKLMGADDTTLNYMLILITTFIKDNFFLERPYQSMITTNIDSIPSPTMADRNNRNFFYGKDTTGQMVISENLAEKVLEFIAGSLIRFYFIITNVSIRGASEANLSSGVGIEYRAHELARMQQEAAAAAAAAQQPQGLPFDQMVAAGRGWFGASFMPPPVQQPAGLLGASFMPPVQQPAQLLVPRNGAVDPLQSLYPGRGFGFGAKSSVFGRNNTRGKARSASGNKYTRHNGRKATRSGNKRSGNKRSGNKHKNKK
jgi:hypothetical protein